MLLRVFVFVTFFVWTHAHDGGFADFCSIDVDGELSSDEMTCKKKLNLTGVAESDAFQVCRHWGRFSVLLAITVGKDELECTWEITGKCDHGDYIRGYCYKTFTGDCHTNWKPAPLNDPQAFRWIALTYDDEMLLKFQLPKKYAEPTVKYTLGQLLNKDKNDKDADDLAVLLKRMPVFGGKPGDIVYYQKGEKEERVLSVCRKVAFGEPNLGLGSSSLCDTKENSDKYSSASFGNCAMKGKLPDGVAKNQDYTLWLTRNVYAAKLGSDGTVDLKHFHRICENYCEHCFAATPDYLKLVDGFTKERFWLTGSRNPIPAGSGCNPKTKPEDLNAWKILYHQKHGDGANPHPKAWKAGLPNRKCSDQGRYAMAYEDGKLIDVPIFGPTVKFPVRPIFDRLPLACVQGVPPYVPKSHTSCLRNSESNGKGGCKCKAGYIDIKFEQNRIQQKLDKSLLDHIAELSTTTPGYVCVKEDCRPQEDRIDPPYDTIIIAIDQSAIKKCIIKDIIIYREWKTCDPIFGAIAELKNWLPKTSRIYFYTYGIKWDTDDAHFLDFRYFSEMRHFTYEIKYGWNNYDYDAAYRYIFGIYMPGYTLVYRPMREAAERWVKMRKRINRAMMIFCTSHRDRDSELDWARKDTLNYLIDHNIELKYMAIGDYSIDKMARDVRDSSQDIVTGKSYETLKKQLEVKFNRYIVCDPITKSQVDDAADRPYE